MGLAVMMVAGTAHAGPAVGTATGYGQGLGGEADERVSASVYVLGAMPGGWMLGGELAGSVEGYTGGYGCDTMSLEPGAVVPAVAVSCVQPAVGAHLLVGSEAAPSARSRLRLELGVGATAVYLIPGQGGSTARDTLASGLLRATYLVELGEAMTGTWWLGPAVEERVVGISDPHVARWFGLVLEGRTR
ncbi:MAG TPA: hypothetical protein VML75_27370 [Kofleriaceae bacterium]|nr:hypothetical protein [Kofleriaceae bacterium]